MFSAGVVLGTGSLDPVRVAWHVGPMARGRLRVAEGEAVHDPTTSSRWMALARCRRPRRAWTGARGPPVVASVRRTVDGRDAATLTERRCRREAHTNEHALTNVMAA